MVAETNKRALTALVIALNQNGTGADLSAIISALRGPDFLDSRKVPASTSSRWWRYVIKQDLTVPIRRAICQIAREAGVDRPNLLGMSLDGPDRIEWSRLLELAKISRAPTHYFRHVARAAQALEILDAQKGTDLSTWGIAVAIERACFHG